MGGVDIDEGHGRGHTPERVAHNGEVASGVYEVSSVGAGLRKAGLCLTGSGHRGIRPTIVAITPAADRPIMIQS